MTPRLLALSDGIAMVASRLVKYGKRCACCGYVVDGGWQWDNLYGCCSACAGCWSTHEPIDPSRGIVCHHGAC